MEGAEKDAVAESKGYATTASGVQGQVAARAVRESDSRSESKSSLGTDRVGTLDGDVGPRVDAAQIDRRYRRGHRAREGPSEARRSSLYS